MKQFTILPLLLVAGCTGLKSEFGQCRPEVTTSPTALKADSELICDIRVEEPAVSKGDTRKDK